VKRTLFLALIALMINTASAQEDPAEYDVVLPDDAQKCVLPASPDKIPDEASLEELKLAKAQVGAFQEQMAKFRACLQKAEESPDNTAGNRQAIVASYNYSVEMEERVANRFNEAVREYKERQAAAGG
jgi:broad specificity phosphatase PhoE